LFKSGGTKVHRTLNQISGIGLARLFFLYRPKIALRRPACKKGFANSKKLKKTVTLQSKLSNSESLKNSTDRALWLRAIRVFEELDCLFSLAKSSTAIGEPSCRPEFVESGSESESALLDFKELRHPTLSLSTSLKSFIPNDVKLEGHVGKIVLLTGECSIL
jgi:hypothetical protein